MRKLTAILLVAVASAAFGQYKPMPVPQPAAPRPTQQQGQLQKQQAPADFRRITMKEAYDMYKKGTAVFVDVRSNEQFSYGHIKGALSLPNSQLMARFKEVPVGKFIITYCACDAEQSSGRAVQTLNQHGIKHTAALVGGWQSWKSAGHPVAVGPK